MSNTTELMRAAFEYWYSDDGKYPNELHRLGDGRGYTSMQANYAWWVWQSAWERKPDAQSQKSA